MTVIRLEMQNVSPATVDAAGADAVPEERPARLRFSRHKAVSSASASSSSPAGPSASHLPQQQKQDNGTSDTQLSNANPRMPDGTRGFTMGRGRRIDSKALPVGTMCT